MPRKYDSDYDALFTDPDVKKVADAGAKFKKAAERNIEVARSAEHAVAMTMSWVGAGEKLLAVTKTLIERELAKPEEPEEKKDKLAKVKGKLGEMTALAETLKGLFPTSLG